MTTDNEALKLAEKCGAEIVTVHFLRGIKNGIVRFTRTELIAFYNEAIQTGRNQLQKELAGQEPVGTLGLGKVAMMYAHNHDALKKLPAGEYKLIPQPTMPPNEKE